MRIWDTPTGYGLISRCLHWGMALLFLWQFTGMILRITLGRTPLVSFWVGTHASVGTLLFALVVLRIVWALLNLRHRPPHGGGTRGLAVRVGHAALYALMLVIPGLAILRAYGSGKGLNFFGMTLIEPTGVQVPALTAPASAFHGLLAWVLLAAIAGHIVMVIVHQRLWRDDVASRMMGPLPTDSAKVR
ncbi:cytochrome b [Verticiella sediminum]|uniref:Cytochrome b n=1 Tax=Verticiella sediminum TaxID=1247510 RepID=A0A556ALW7_9BURK|nr:cytochrome b [Verticiella sediminum]TSH93876.1 cytochrome b [Verticiella sediminum]